MTYLPSGHTHEDIDRMFKRYSDLRWAADCDTASVFLDQWVGMAYKSKIPMVHILQGTYDWKSFLHPHIATFSGILSPLYLFLPFFLFSFWFLFLVLCFYFCFFFSFCFVFVLVFLMPLFSIYPFLGTSKFRAFHVTKSEAGIVSMKVMRSPLDNDWLGRPNSDAGYEILRSVPPGFPLFLPPTPVCDEKMKSIPYTFNHIGRESTAWWNSFFENQFFWCPHAEPLITSTCWDFVPAIHPMEAALYNEMPQRPLRGISIDGSRPVSLAELTEGELVAVSACSTFYELQSEDDAIEGAYEMPRPKFWIAKITSLDEGDDTIHLAYFVRSKRNHRVFNLDMFSVGSCKIGAVLAHGFTLTTVKRVRRVTLRFIADALAADES